MKKLGFLAALLLTVNVSFSSGLLTNSNQSAQYIRMLSRNASLGIDGVYYNPAGLIKLEDGWHFSFSSQTVFQTRIVDSKFPLLNDGYYEGETNVPVFPNLYAIYKKDKWAFSFGVGPNAGGGTSSFERGLPSFEIPISKVVPGLAGLTMIDPSLNVTGYEADLTFDGSSIFWGIQLGATYKISDMFSVYGGVRYLPSKNEYAGTISNIQLKVGSDYYPASDWLSATGGTVSGYAVQASAGADIANGAAGSMQPIIDQGGGAYTLAQLEGAGFIDASQRAQLEGGLQLMGVPDEQINAMNAGQVQGAYVAAGEELTTTAATLNGTAASLNGTAAQLGDKEVDTKQTGAGLTPILGLNFFPNEHWNIGIKYEHKTYMTIENNTKVDDLGLFPDGDESRSDLPGILGIGVGYTDKKFEAQASYTMYFDKYVGWGGNVRDMRAREIDNNGYELALGFQFNVTDNFSVSIGGLTTQTGAGESYHSDFSYSNTSYTLGGGIMWKITNQLTLDAGFLKAFYKDTNVSFFDPDLNSNYNESYTKETINIAVGLSYSIFR